jgi:protein-L-isoaspartate(D-aspartate) O-methyltransferase
LTEQNFEQMRRAMVASQLRTNAVNDPRVVAAMGLVARERFLPEAQAGLAYLDIATPIGKERALPAPVVLGRLLTEARVRSGERALVIGAATGYSAAVLLELGLHVTALEDDASFAANRLPSMAIWVSGPLAAGWADGAPYDLVLVDGAIEQVPAAIVDQIADGGRLAGGLIDNGVTRLMIGRKAGGAFGVVRFADAEVPILPGFAIAREFSF